jgi:hypothetical protein
VIVRPDALPPVLRLWRGAGSAVSEVLRFRGSQNCPLKPARKDRYRERRATCRDLSLVSTKQKSDWQIPNVLWWDTITREANGDWCLRKRHRNGTVQLFWPKISDEEAQEFQRLKSEMWSGRAGSPSC